jgi:hypothetical protein
MDDTKRNLSVEKCVQLPVAHGSGGFVHMRTVPAQGVKRKHYPVLSSTRQFGSQAPRAQQMSGWVPGHTRQMGD